jgi:hypothetical protein
MTNTHFRPIWHIPKLKTAFPPVFSYCRHLFSTVTTCFRCSRTNITWRGPDVCRPFPDPFSFDTHSFIFCILSLFRDHFSLFFHFLSISLFFWYPQFPILQLFIFSHSLFFSLSCWHLFWWSSLSGCSRTNIAWRGPDVAVQGVLTISIAYLVSRSSLP